MANCPEGREAFMGAFSKSIVTVPMSKLLRTMLVKMIFHNILNMNVSVSFLITFAKMHLLMLNTYQNQPQHFYDE